MSDRRFLSWPFFEARHRELADNLLRWCDDNLSGRYAEDLDGDPSGDAVPYRREVVELLPLGEEVPVR